MHREIHEVETRWGKSPGPRPRARMAASRRRYSPECDDCRRIAAEHKVPLRVAMEAAGRRTIEMISERLHINEIFYSIQGACRACRPSHACSCG